LVIVIIVYMLEGNGSNTIIENIVIIENVVAIKRVVIKKVVVINKHTR
jgi:hypothetical protein